MKQKILIIIQIVVFHYNTNAQIPECDERICNDKSVLIGKICSKGIKCNELTLNLNQEYCKCKCDTNESTDYNSQSVYVESNSILALGVNDSWYTGEVILKNYDHINENDIIPFAAQVKFENGLKAILRHNHVLENVSGSKSRVDETEIGSKVNFENYKDLRIMDISFGEFYGNSFYVESHTDVYYTDDIDSALTLLRLDKHDNTIVSDTIYPIKNIELGNISYLPYGEKTNLCSKGKIFDRKMKRRLLKSYETKKELERKKELIKLFDESIPEISIDYFLGSNVDNACSKYINSKKEVYIFGGLLHNASLNELKAVIAHEIGHLNSDSSEKYPSGELDWASCEKEAWYWGLMVSMRRVYCSEESIKSIYYGVLDRQNRFDNGNGTQGDSGAAYSSCIGSVKPEDLLEIALDCIQLNDSSNFIK